MDKDKKIKAIFAGGATGGHLFPAISIYEELLERDKENQGLFVSTINDFEKKVFSSLSLNYKQINAKAIKGKSFITKFVSVFFLLFGILKAFFIIKKFKANIVVGLGSYSSFACILGAKLAQVPVVICEQNKIAGITNRISQFFAKRIYLHFEDTKKIRKSDKAICVGNPVRKQIYEKTIIKKDSTLFYVFILGGSQGANIINLNMIEALEKLDEKEKYFFIHQTGAKDIEKVKNTYKKLNIKADIQPFFTNMRKVYDMADLLIARAGATTISEILILSKACIFIPLAIASDNHQFENAKFLYKKNCCKIILEKELSPQILSDKIAFFRKNPQSLLAMKENIKKLKTKNAAKSIVDDFYKILKAKQYV